MAWRVCVVGVRGLVTKGRGFGGGWEIRGGCGAWRVGLVGGGRRRAEEGRRKRR